MSQTLEQIFIANPITTNTSTDLIYFSQSPYTAGNDAAMTYANFEAQFAPAGSVASGTINQLAWYSATGAVVAGLPTANNGTLITSAAGVPSISSTLPSAVQNNITALGTINETLSFTAVSAGARRIVFNGNTDGTLALQAGLGSATFGGGYVMFGLTHASYAGWTKAAISNQAGAKFAINNNGIATGTDVFTCDSSGNVVANGSLTAATYTSTADLQLTPNAGNELDINFSASDIPGVQIRSASATGNPRLLFYRGNTTALSGLYAGQNDSLTGSGNGIYLRNIIAGGKIFLRDSTGNAVTVSGGNTTLSGSLTTSQTAGIIGTTTNNNANAGSVGEYISSNVNSASFVSLTTATAKDMTSIELTAGDWEIGGNLVFRMDASTNVNRVLGQIAGVSNTFGDASYSSALQYGSTGFVPGLNLDIGIVIPTLRTSISSTVTRYIVARADFTAGICKVAGNLWARRVR